MVSKLSLSKGMMALLRQLCKELGPLQASVPIGGSCGLALQGVEIGKAPRDVDLYYDREDGQELRSMLLAYEIDPPQQTETERYRSILSHYEIHGVTIELVGDFEVSTGGSFYKVRIGSFLQHYVCHIDFEGQPIYLMPLSHEFVFNILRERRDRSVAIASVMKRDLPRHIAVLNRILQENVFALKHIEFMQELLGCRLPQKEEGLSNG